MTRTEIKQKAKENLNRIKSLKHEIELIEDENIELAKQMILLSDEEQQFTEEIESHPRQKWERKDNYLDGKLVGRIHWNEEFKDAGTGESIFIDRSKIVRIDGEWI